MNISSNRFCLFAGHCALVVLVVLLGCQHFDDDNEEEARRLAPEGSDDGAAVQEDDPRAGPAEITIVDDSEWQVVADPDQIASLIDRASADGDEIQSGKWVLGAEACRDWVDWEVAIDRCTVAAEPHDRAVILTLTYECGADGCEQARWAVLSPDSYTRLIWADESVTTVAPGLDRYFVAFFEPPFEGLDVLVSAPDETEADAPSDGEAEQGEESDESVEEPTLYAVDMSGDIESLANCISPQISPGAQWVVCRDLEGRVLRVAIDGSDSEVEVVDDPDLEDRSIYLDVDEGAVPGQPWFDDDETLRYEIITGGEEGGVEVETRSVEWSE